MPLRDQIQFIERKLLKDSRGSFLKIIHGREPHLPPRTGEIYAVWAPPGQSRAGHYHPKTAEWFTVVQGECRMILVDPATGERLEQLLKGETPGLPFTSLPGSRTVLTPWRHPGISWSWPTLRIPMTRRTRSHLILTRVRSPAGRPKNKHEEV